MVGANGPEGAKLLGGDPAYNTPPAGWDGIDPKTGEPPGIDKGWGYMPGATVVDTVRALARKTVDWPYELSKAYMSGVPQGARDALALAVRRQRETGEVVRRYAQAVLAGRKVDPYRTMGLLTSAEVEAVAAMTGVDVKRKMYDWVVAAEEVRHIERRHGTAGIDASTGEVPVVADDYALLPRVIIDGKLEPAGATENGLPAVALRYQAGNALYLFVFEVLKIKTHAVPQERRKMARPAIVMEPA